MELGSLRVLLLVLACPLMMVWMTRGDGHGEHAVGQSHAQGGVDQQLSGGFARLVSRRRAALDSDIATLEEDETKTNTQRTRPRPSGDAVDSVRARAHHSETDGSRPGRRF